MRTHFAHFVARAFPVTQTRWVSMAVIGAILVVTQAITTGPILAAERVNDGAAFQPTNAAGEREQQEDLAAETRANLDAFNRMKQAPSLFTRHSGTTVWAISAEIRANLDAFARMEQAPTLFKRVPITSELTHPWGGDALSPDY